MKKFKNGLFLMLSLIITMIIVGCAANDSEDTTDSSSGEKQSAVTVWAWDPNFNIKALEMAEEVYKEDNPDFDLEIIENTHQDIVQKMNITLSSGTTQGLPNILLLDDTRAQTILNSYPDAFVELTEYFDSSDFAEYKLGSTQMDGKDYGLPFDAGTIGFYIRTDYLEEAGYTMEDLQDITWEEYIEIGKDIKEATGNHMISYDPNGLGMIAPSILAADSWWIDDAGNVSVADNEALREAFEIYKEMWDSGIVATHTDFAEQISLFHNGGTASVISGNWIGASIRAEESQAGKWAIAPFPRLGNIPGAVNASNSGGSSWYVLDLDGSEEAAKFLGETFGKDSEFYQDLLTDVGAVGTYLPAADGEAYEMEDEFFSDQKIYQDLISWMEQVPSARYGEHQSTIVEIMSNEVQGYLNGQDLDEVLDSIQAQVEALD